MALTRKARAGLAPSDVDDMSGIEVDAASEAATLKHRGLSWRGQERLAGYLLIAPALLMFGMFLLGPLVYGIYLSLTDRNLLADTSFIWFENYANLHNDPLFFKSLRVTGLLFLEVTPPAILISFVFANLLNQRLKGVGILRLAYFLPLVASGVAVATMWRFVFTSDGLFNTFLSFFVDVDTPYLVLPQWAPHVVAVILLWSLVPLNTVFYMAALQTVPRDQLDAAIVDGANFWQKALHVTWPLCAPTTFLLVILNLAITSVGSWDILHVLTGGGPEFSTTTTAFLLYLRAFRGQFEIGLGSAMGVALTAILLLLTVGLFRAQRRWSHYG
ncbi:MAG: sugar ABC transporter permease [Acidimicrobiaceae bacterium]|nr:sugar ABC transporter permease [Acidimicrobiaceae bacterium]MCY3650535.1 sugar ABC transporter permease [Acidimicrobiaceae bacterium]MDE0517791.1 sugar ABC transporter permease [Acidimicrobiaceae bacterium]MDE0656264.1 sugar ABC transporter permease [Acidimicrobiaceae bacterium]MXW97404.1 sugar ABC transporter permease [Acidimicrobiaceae bacterium]